MMGWEIHPAKAAFPEFAQEWDRLNEQLYESHPLYDSRFVGPMLEFFASGKEQLCIHRNDGLVTGALILQADGMGRWSSFKPSQSQATALLLKDPHVLETLFRELPGFVWSIEFYAIDPRYSPDLSQRRLVTLTSPQAHTIGVYPHTSFSEYWDTRSKNLRANIRRYLNRAEKEGAPPALSKFADSAEMSAGVGRFGQLESAGRKGEAGTAISVDNEQGAFYSEVLRRFAMSDQAAVYELRVGDQLAASRLVITNDHMFVILKTTYDEMLARFAPSRILLHHVIQEQLVSQTGKAIELYTNATRDQKEWATFGCTIQNVQIFRNSTIATTYSLLKTSQCTLRSLRSLTKPADMTLDNQIEVKTFLHVKDFSCGQYELDEFVAKDNIETSIDWFDLMQQQVYPDDPGVRYYFSSDDKHPRIILPLRLSTHGNIKTIESLGNYYTSLYSPLLSKDSDLLAIRHLLTTATLDHGGAHVMRFAPMDPESLPFVGILNGLRAIGWVPFEYFCFGNWYLKVTDDWEGYLRKRSSNLRSSIKRRGREFAADGGTLEIVTSAEGIDQAIAAFHEVYSASWKVPEPYADFVPSLIRHLAGIGMLRLGIAHLRGRPVAAQLWIVGQEKASIYKVAYHKAFASFSPGTVLTSHLMQHVIDRDHVKEVDFLIGDDEYKPFWMTDRRERWGIVAYNPRTLLGSALLVKEISGRIAKKLMEKTKQYVLKPQQSRTKPAVPGTDVRTKNIRFHTAQRELAMYWTLHPIKQFAEYANQWDALAQSRPGTPFLETAFLKPSIDAFGSGDELLCLLQSRDQLRAAVIMERGRKCMWQTFQPSQLPLGAWISDGKVDLVSACNELISQLPGCTLGIGASQLDSRIQVRPDNGPKVRTQDYIQTAWVDVESSFEAYWEARGKNLKQNTRKQRNKLLAEGIEIRMECVTEPADVKKAIEDYGSLESTGWKATDGTAIRSDNAQGHFYQKMLENYCALGRGRIYRYWFGEKVVAMDLCIHDDAAIVILKTAYDESYKTISPSTLMRHDQFQLLFEKKEFPRIEFYGKVMEWHTRWAIQSRSIYHVTAYRWAWLKQLHKRLSAPSSLPSQEAAATTQN